MEYTGQSEEDSLLSYQTQLKHIEEALLVIEDGPDRENLISLKEDIGQLILLTKESLQPSTSSNNETNTQIDDEYALFMAEIQKEGVASNTNETGSKSRKPNIEEELKSLEGMKCRAPHKHTWGDIVYHNAMVCSVVTQDFDKFDDIEVKVMFTNPTHQEMLPCPYYLETECKFSEEQCRYSHGETVQFSVLQEYAEPKFESLSIGSSVLAKQQNKLWHRAKIKKVYGEKCIVKFESNQKDIELELHDILPLDNGEGDGSSDSESNGDESEEREDVINTSLLNSPSEQALGDWEKYTKGIGSKLMQKMGYVVGTGLGRRADGRIDPVTAVILPTGKSLDHCMHLRENANGEKDLFSVERKLKRLQKKQEVQNKRAYEREQKKVDVFHFLNDTLLAKQSSSQEATTKKNHREEIKKESGRGLNVASLKVEEDIKRAQLDLYKIKESLTRHSDNRSQMNRNLKNKLAAKENELKTLQVKALNIKNEQSIRNDKKKITIF